MLHLGTGEFDRALTQLDAADAANRALGNYTEKFALATTRNTIHILRGNYTRAFEEFAALQELAESRITAQILICARQQLAWSYFELVLGQV